MKARLIEGWKNLTQAGKCSAAGLRAATRYQRAFRQEVLILLVIVPLALRFGDGGLERALLIGAWVLVMIVEILNSAIETLVDRVGRERNELSGRAKDLGSAAVFLAIVLASLVWALILAG